MKKILFFVFLAILSTAPAYAAGGHGGGHGGGGHGGGGGWHGGGLGWWGLGLGLGLEAAYFGNPYLYYPYPGYYYAYPGYYPYTGYYYPYTPPVTVINQQPPVVTAPQAPAPTQAQSWYYCESAKGYYPYVPTCPEAWRMVPAVPPEPMR